MKKQRQSNQPRKKNKGNAPKTTEPTRRSLLTNAPLIVGGIVAIGALGYFGVSTVQADLAEQDLDVVGSGVPTIVQIHDPTCPVCLALQKETRAAFDMIDDGQLEYRVASIASNVGSDFAAKHASSHATLLFFDGNGTITQRVQAPSDRDTLYAAFMAHIAAGS